MDEQMYKHIVKLVQAAMQGDKKARQEIEQIMQAAQQGDQQSMQIAQAIQEVAQSLQDAGQGTPVDPQGAAGMQQAAGAEALTARLGAKLNYVNYLRGKCPEGYEMQMFRKGGAVCKKCVKKREAGGNIVTNVASSGNKTIDEFRCGRKMKAKKAACGTKV